MSQRLRSYVTLKINYKASALLSLSKLKLHGLLFLITFEKNKRGHIDQELLNICGSFCLPRNQNTFAMFLTRVSTNGTQVLLFRRLAVPWILSSFLE